MAFPSIHGLTQPVSDTAVLRAVLNQHWRGLVHDFLSISSGSELHRHLDSLVRDLLKRDARRAVRVLRRPTVACLTGAMRRQENRESLMRELDLNLLFELAAQGDLAHEVVIDPQGPWPVLRSLAARVAREPPPDSRLRFSAGSVRTETSSGVVEMLTPPDGYVEVVDGILFATSDNNPLLSVQGHPERAGNAVDLGGHSAAEWVDSLRAALVVIAKHQPLIAEEMRLGLELLVPVGWHDERHFSVSYEESVGAIYLTLHPSAMTMAEALIHEFQHNKLNAVFGWDPVLRNAHSPLYASPVRPDPRPLHGVLMAVHAFQPVAKLYERMTDAHDPLSQGHDWEKRFRQIVGINREGAETVLRHGQPTAVGEGLLSELRAIDDYYARYF